MIALLLLLATLPSTEPVAVDYVDIVERNHVYDRKGAFEFTQWLFWDFDASVGRHHIVDWRFVRRPGCSRDMAHNLDLTRRTLVLMDQGKMRRIHFRTFRETSANFDRDRWESEHQRGRMLRRELAE